MIKQNLLLLKIKIKVSKDFFDKQLIYIKFKLTSLGVVHE